jgi:diguanylate cyclase (GGDEF)-like protein
MLQIVLFDGGMDSVNLWSRGTLKSLIVPGGVLLLAAGLLIGLGLSSISSSAIDFYYYAVFGAGTLLAWRFRSSRTLLALIFLLLSHRALLFFSSAAGHISGPGRVALEAVCLLLPLNLLIIAFTPERGLTVPSIAPKFCLLFIESVFVAIICRPGQSTGPSFLRAGFSPHTVFHWTAVPPFGVMVFTVVFCILLVRALAYRKPLESGLLWSLVAAFLALSAGGAGRGGEAYFATAGLVLVSSIIENSYVLAYHDELTSLPGRRAFNESLLQLEEPYAIAVVDIDHFKKFNDTHGHETGDEVLRMVAGRLARVTGGGQAYRVGGEEFSIVFPKLTMKETVPHLERVRSMIENSTFRVRGGQDRRQAPRGPDRRSSVRSKGARIRQLALEESTSDLSVTVSIGVAEPTARTAEVEDVIRAADKALYRAKQGGRNRVETASASRTRTSRLKRSTA